MADSGAGGAVSPFPMGDPKDIKQLMSKVQQQMDELYQNRIGGAMLGDVFGVGNDEVMSLILAAAGGLTKIANTLSVLLKANFGLMMDANGIYVQLKTNGGIAVDSTGLYLSVSQVKASGSDIDAGTDDLKFVTPKAIKDSHNVPDVAPGTTGNTLVSNGTNWVTTPAVVNQLKSEKDSANGYAGLNAASRITKGVITTDDVIIDLASKGLVLKDTQATPHYWRVKVSTLGVLTTSDLGTATP